MQMNANDSIEFQLCFFCWILQLAYLQLVHRGCQLPVIRCISAFPMLGLIPGLNDCRPAFVGRDSRCFISFR